MEIYNRWGELIFESDINFEWDGLYRGKMVIPELIYGDCPMLEGQKGVSFNWAYFSNSLRLFYGGSFS